ncbi:MAG: hypothetical protein K1X78_08595 [Verrucomicrobiaceae bacterium]|nr:hypothetical protein [Verrucomicrobiaceae bacterium]
MAAALVAASALAQEKPGAKWDERETRLANEYLSLLVERPEYGRVVELLWDLYAKHDATKLLLENIRTQAADSKHASVRLVEAHLLRKSGDLKPASEIYDQVLKADAANRYALRARADIAGEMKQPAAALPLLKKLAETLPDGDAAKVDAWIEYGNAALSAGRNADAADAWEAAAKLKPGDLDLARQVAQLLLQAGFPDRAATFFEGLTKQADPGKRLEALHDLARIHSHADQFQKADAALREALGLLHFRDGRYMDFFRQRVRLHERFGALDDLKNKLLAEARKEPPSEQSLSDLVTFYNITVDVDERIRWLRELAKLAPGTEEYRWLLVRALLDHDEAAEAARLIDERLHGDTRDMSAVVLLRCEAELRQGRTKEAVRRLRALLDAQPGDPEAQKQILAFAQENNLDEIVQTILEARLGREPEKPEAVFELAAFHRSRRNDEAMRKALDDYLHGAAAYSSHDPKQTKARRLSDVAAFLAAGNDLDAAIMVAREAVAKPDAGREAHLRLADLLIEQGESEEALKLLEDAWSDSAGADERIDVDERILALLIGDQTKQADAAKTKKTTEFQLPTILSGAGFASSTDEESKKDATPEAVTDHAKKLIAAAAGADTPARRLERAAWWAWRADLIDEAYRLLRRLVFDERGEVRKDRTLNVDQLLFDVALAGQDTALEVRQLKILAARDPANRVRHILRLGEVMMEGAQKAESALQNDRGAILTGPRPSPLLPAVELLERTLRENPDSEPLLSALSQTYALMRETEKALKLWEEAARRAEGARAVPFLTRQAELLLRTQQVPQFIGVQISIIERETEVKRRRELFQRFMDRLLFTDSGGGELAPTVLRDRLTMVEQAVQERVRRHPFDGFYHEALAQVHERRGDAAKAFAEMKQAYYTAPDAPFSLDQLRAAALRVGDLKSAIYFQKQITAAAPAKDEAAESRQLVQLLEQTFQIAEADRVRRRLESRFAQDTKALGDLAAHYRTTGQDEAERRVYEQIVRVRPWDARARLRLALKCLGMADDAEAARQLRELLAATPPAKNTLPVARWPLPLTSQRRAADAGPVTEIVEALGTAAGIESAEVERLRGWLSFPRAEFLELPDDAALVRLRAIEELAGLVREQGGEALSAWIRQWSHAGDAQPAERLWALCYCGADEEFHAALRESVGREESLDMEFAYVWLLVRSHGMVEALAWAGEKQRADRVLEQRRRLLLAAVSMLAGMSDPASSRQTGSNQTDRLISAGRRGNGAFRFSTEDLRAFGTTKLVRGNMLLDITRKLEDRQRYDEALVLGECLRNNSAGLEGEYAFFLSRIAENAERWDLQRDYLGKVAAAPKHASRYNGTYDPFVLGLGALSRVAASAEEKSRMLDGAWRNLQETPPSALTTLRRAAVAGLAGATEHAADVLGGYIEGDFLSSRQLGLREGSLMPQQGSLRNDEAVHLRTVWEETKEIGASLAQQGLGEVAANLDERLDGKWGGTQLGPRTGFEFNEWRINLLVRRLREANHPGRLRLIREYLGPVDMKAETAVEALTELGAKLEASGMPREAIEVYRRLPERAPTNSDYAAWLLRACENALEIEPGRSFAIEKIEAVPPFKPVSIGDETLREKHAHFLALAHDVDELQRLGFLEKPTKMLQGRIPPEVAYLREFGLLMERRGEDTRALAAWERLHAAFLANADAGLEPDEESCLHRGQILLRQGQTRPALAALREVKLKDPLSRFAADALRLRGKLAAGEELWDEVRDLMLVAVDRKSADSVIALADELHAHVRTADALSFLTQAERTLKSDAERFRLRLAQLRLLVADKSWSPGRGRPQIASLFRASTRDRRALDQMREFLQAESAGQNAAAWITALNAETKSGADRLLAAAALCCFAAHMPEGPLPGDVEAAWQQARDEDRICLDAAARALLDNKRAGWALQACSTAAGIPSAKLQGRKLPVTARVLAALDDRNAMAELFTSVSRMPFPGGQTQTIEWAQAFEEAARPELARELFENALTTLRQRQSQQPELLKAWVEFLIRRQDFEAAEAALVKDSWLVIHDAAPLVFTLYRDWGMLASLDAELPKFYLPGGVAREVRFLAAQHLAGAKPSAKNPAP